MTHFQHSFLVPFHLTDPGGIVFYGHVFTLAHQAFEQFVIQKLRCPWEQWFQNSDWIVPVKHTEADYTAPLCGGKECQVEVKILDHAHSSFTVEALFTQSILCCKVKTVHVFCDRQTGKKMAIPEPFLKAFETLSQ